MGVSVNDAQVKITGSKLSALGPLLITHWGLSGPCILRLSAWGARELAKTSWQFTIVVNWMTEYNENTLRERFQQQRGDTGSQKIISRSPFGLPQRLWQYLAEQSGIHADTRWADLTSKDQNTFIKNCCAQEFAVNGKTTFKEEFVTCGGISLQQIDANAMQSKLIPNLFFAGEVMDVDGITGGFNFQHAWTSGFVAARAIASRLPIL
jgi:predicted Rossmann fold flavoprotein